MAEKRIFWDFEGTLGWREPGWTGTLLAMLNEQGLAMGVTVEQARPHFSEGFRWHAPELAHRPVADAGAWWDEIRPIVRRAALAFGATVPTADGIADNFRGRFLALEGWRIFPDVLPCLAELKNEGWEQEIASNNFPELEDIVSALGIRPFFRRVHTSAFIGFEKPHPDFYRALGAGRGAWMVGDSLEADYLGAEKAGLSAILVRKHSGNAIRFLNDLSGLPKLLRDTVGGAG